MKDLATSNSSAEYTEIEEKKFFNVITRKLRIHASQKGSFS